MSKSFSHAPLYNFCHELYCKNIDTLSGVNIHPAIANSPVNKLFYWYPATSNALLNIYPDINTLTQKGWIPGFVNTPFIIWYRKDQTIQCIPVDLTSAQMVRTGSLNTDLPFSYRWVRVVTGNKSYGDDPVYVCADPVIAALLIDRGMLTVAMGGDFLPHAHEKHLVALNKPHHCGNQRLQNTLDVPGQSWYGQFVSFSQFGIHHVDYRVRVPDNRH